MINKSSNQINEEILFVISTGREESREMENKKERLPLFILLFFKFLNSSQLTSSMILVSRVVSCYSNILSPSLSPLDSKFLESTDLH